MPPLHATEVVLALSAAAWALARHGHVGALVTLAAAAAAVCGVVGLATWCVLAACCRRRPAPAGPVRARPKED
jgi:hypothetical protein